MTQYRYVGPGPDVEPISNSVIHPGDIWNFTEEPAFGRWELLGGDQGSQKPSEATEGSAQSETQADGENAPTDASGSSSTKES